MQSGMKTMLVYQDGDDFAVYAGAGSQPVAVYDRERAVLEAARRVGEKLKVEQMRVVFIIDVPCDHATVTRNGHM
jgi:hypothetical protein